MSQAGRASDHFDDLKHHDADCPEGEQRVEWRGKRSTPAVRQGRLVCESESRGAFYHSGRGG